MLGFVIGAVVGVVVALLGVLWWVTENFRPFG